MTPTETIELLQRLGIAFLLGLFVGLEREYSRQERAFAGARTFPLIGLAGATAALLADLTSPAVLVVVAGMFVALLGAAYVLVGRTEEDPGLTTEMAALLVFLLGAIVYHGYAVVAVVVTVAVTVTLSIKDNVHGFVRKLSSQDVEAALKFATVTFIVLPLLPNEAYGPYAAFNPYKTWLMVVLIAGIGFLGYVLTKIVGSGRGIAWTGLVGGTVSSTAVTLSFSKRSRDVEELSRSFAMAIILACTVMGLRVAVEVAVVNPGLLPKAAIPLLAMTLTGLVAGFVLYRSASRDATDAPPVKNPFELSSALKFAAFYAGISFLIRALGATVGDSGVYLASLVSGLADVDAVTLSLAEQANNGLDAGVAVRGIVLSTIANTAVKGGLALTLGSKALGRTVGVSLALMFVAGLATWPFL